MPKKGHATPPTTRCPPTDPESLLAYLQRFLEWMRVQNYSEQTTRSRDQHLRAFIQWCEDRGLSQPREITRAVVERYQRYLFHYRKANGELLSRGTQHSRLVPLRAYFQWLARGHYILYNPTSELELPRPEKRLPKQVLTPAEVETILRQPDVTTPLGLRDRAILETFYSTGIRRLELIHLKQGDLDTERGTLMIRQGKGKKDRLVPIGDRALAWIRRYRDDVRPTFAPLRDDGTLFLTQLGQVLSRNRLSQLVHAYVKAADLGKLGSCHLFRHTLATTMLENGADIRFIQAMLGHEQLDTTQIYTQVSIRKLKEVHTLTHPAHHTPSPRHEPAVLPDCHPTDAEDQPD